MNLIECITSEDIEIAELACNLLLKDKDIIEISGILANNRMYEIDNYDLEYIKLRNCNNDMKYLMHDLNIYFGDINSMTIDNKNIALRKLKYADDIDKYQYAIVNKKHLQFSVPFVAFINHINNEISYTI